MGSSKNKAEKEYPYIDFANWPKNCVKMYQEESIRQMDDLKAQSARIQTKARSVLSMNGITLGFILSALIGFGSDNSLIFIGGFAILFSLMVTIYLLLVKSNGQIVFDFFIGADPDARVILTNESNAMEEMLNGYLRRCEDMKEDIIERAKQVWISATIFVTGLFTLLLTIIMSTGAQ